MSKLTSSLEPKAAYNLLPPNNNFSPDIITVNQHPVDWMVVDNTSIYTALLQYHELEKGITGSIYCHGQHGLLNFSQIKQSVALVMSI